MTKTDPPFFIAHCIQYSMHILVVLVKSCARESLGSHHPPLKGFIDTRCTCLLRIKQ